MSATDCGHARGLPGARLERLVGREAQGIEAMELACREREGGSDHPRVAPRRPAPALWGGGAFHKLPYPSTRYELHRMVIQTANMPSTPIAQIDKLSWARALPTAEEISFAPYWRLIEQSVTCPRQIGLVKILRIPRTLRYTSCPTPVAYATLAPRRQQPRSHRRGRSDFLSA